MEDQLEFQRLSTIAKHLDCISAKLFQPETELTALERMLLFRITREKLYALADEAAELLPKRGRGRPPASNLDKDKLLSAKIKIWHEYRTRYEKGNSEGIYEELCREFGIDRSSVIKAIKTGDDFVNSAADRAEQLSVEKQKDILQISQQCNVTVQKAAEIYQQQADENRKINRMKNKIWMEGAAALEEIKYK